jgi:hypothetical protein
MCSMLCISIYLCDISPLKKNGQSEPELLRGVIIEVMTHNISHIRIKQKKCSESKTLLQF